MSLPKYHVKCVGVQNGSVHALSTVAEAADSSVSQGFFRLGLALSVPCPSRTVLGISLMPGTGWPVVMSSTIWENEVGYGASGLAPLVVTGVACGVSAAEADGLTPFVVFDGIRWDSRQALY